MGARWPSRWRCAPSLGRCEIAPHNGSGKEAITGRCPFLLRPSVSPSAEAAAWQFALIDPPALYSRAIHLDVSALGLAPSPLLGCGTCTSMLPPEWERAAVLHRLGFEGR